MIITKEQRDKIVIGEHTVSVVLIVDWLFDLNEPTKY